MRENGEAMAHALASKLCAAGVEASAVGAGVHWRVTARSGLDRGLVVHCFWYERDVHALMLGLNPANARTQASAPRVPYEGPEYLVCLSERSAPVADGRTRSEQEALACAHKWLAGVDLDRLVTESPFIDEKPRAMRAIAARLDPELRWDVAPEPSCTLWVYEEGRSCAIDGADGAVTCRFLLIQAPVAYAIGLADVAAAVRAWLVARVGVAELARVVPEVRLESHVETIESDPAAWHWAHVHDRITDPEDVLAPLRNLIEALASRPLPVRFYSFSSLNSFCFSASSHYPWVDDNLPRIWPDRDGAFVIGERRFDLEGAVAQVESVLAAYPVKPFFGSAPHHERERLAASLRRSGSSLRPFLFQRGAWFSLRVGDGMRRCDVSGQWVEFADGSQHERREFASLDEATRDICDFIERGVPLDRLAYRPSHT